MIKYKLNAIWKLLVSENPKYLLISIATPMPHCIIKVPTKINKLKDVKDVPAIFVGKERATAGWVSVKTIDVNK